MSSRITVKSVYCNATENIEFVQNNSVSTLTPSEVAKKLESTWKKLTPEQKIPWEIIGGLVRKSGQTRTIRTMTLETSPVAYDHPTLVQCRETLASYTITKLVRVASYRNMLLQCRHRARIVYKNLDWGWNEKVYQEALKYELGCVNYQVVSEIPQTIIYQGIELGDGINARTDLLVTHRDTGQRLLLELKG